jgi:class 3 adenylate cyclase
MDTMQGAILVVDDNEMNRDMLARRLQRRGYSVAVAEDGQHALQMIAAQSFDLVLLDIMMPGISGLDVLKSLRERFSVTDLPIIMATAKNQSEDIVTALKLGANDYVTKPLDFPVVIARMQTQLSLKRAMQEIQRLAEQLERHNHFIRKTFGRYLTDDVVASLLDSTEGLQLGGENRKVTMLMTDLRGFTSLAERLAPDQVVTILNRYLSAMIEVITRYHGTIDEFIGDAIFVIFGAPIQRPDDAQRAVACAVAMQLAMASVNDQLRGDGLPEVEMGIGVHTGIVVVGNIGSDKRAKYGVVGSHVNLTSRIESYTVGGQILTSEATQQELAALLKIGQQMRIEAKGIDQAHTIYDVQGIGDPYNLFLPDVQDQLVSLREALPLRYNVVTSKHLSDTSCTGHFVKLSAKRGEVYADTPVAPWSDIKIQLTRKSGDEISGGLYAKVVDHLPEHRSGFIVHFTSISPAVATFLSEVLALHVSDEMSATSLAIGAADVPTGGNPKGAPAPPDGRRLGT